MLLLTTVVCGLWLQLAESGAVNRKPVCYERVGCFSNGAPFTSPIRRFALLPEKPDYVLTKYLLFTKESPKAAFILDARHPDKFTTQWPNYKSRPTKIIVNGFMDGPSFDPWILEMKDELLHHDDYNVIVVDWTGGNGIPYIQATGNTRLVGAQVADLVLTIQKNNSQSASDFHIIGHSLGAHIGGYAGERIPRLGRISGLDPAGPYYEGTEPAVRLDKTDAVFVDILHSDAEQLQPSGVGRFKGMGMNQQIGHADYYPNGGTDQPGCETSSISELIMNSFNNGELSVQGVFEYIACNHARAVSLYKESINSGCPFMGFPCQSKKDFDAGLCNKCPSGDCGYMGFKADKFVPKQPTRFFLDTTDQSPFCQYHIEVTVRLHNVGAVERGQLKVKIQGSKGDTITKTLDENPTEYYPNDVYTYDFGVPSDVGDVTSVGFSWNHMGALTDFSSWNILGLRRPELRLERIDVMQYESQRKVSFCPYGRKVETDKLITIDGPCHDVNGTGPTGPTQI